MGYPRLRDCLSSPSARDGILRGLSRWCPRIVCCHRRDRNFIIAITRWDSLWSLLASSSSPSASRNFGAVLSDCLSKAGRDNKESRLGDDEDKDSYHGGDKQSSDTSPKILNADDGDTEADEDHKESCLGDGDDKDSRHGGDNETTRRP